MAYPVAYEYLFSQLVFQTCSKMPVLLYFCPAQVRAMETDTAAPWVERTGPLLQPRMRDMASSSVNPTYEPLSGTLRAKLLSKPSKPHQDFIDILVVLLQSLSNSLVSCPLCLSRALGKTHGKRPDLHIPAHHTMTMTGLLRTISTIAIAALN
ncbi:hypothetical protein BJY00DRAFT_35102 [Aspergillus carlsbadensis]|nr:hypothetical protein BJY00DRAFT_35102 [Aspergillus carlsbadensis]